MDLHSQIRPSHVRAVALTCWTGAVMLTAVLGMSAWQAFEEAQPIGRDAESPAAIYLAKYTGMDRRFPAVR